MLILKRINANEAEILCVMCDGAGTIADEGAKQTFKVKLCPQCNGHGIVVFHKANKIKPYAITKEAKCRFQN